MATALTGYFWPWLGKKRAWKLFSETVNLYESIIPELSNEKLEVIRKGKVPKLVELNLHMGTA